MTRMTYCTGGLTDADCRYCGKPHPRCDHRDRQAGVLGVRRVQLAGMPLHLRLRHRQGRTTHIRIPASVCTMGYLPYAQWAALSAAEKAKHWTLKRGWKLVQGAVAALTAEEYAHLEKTHLCCTAAAVSDDREPLLPHWHVEGS